MLHNEPQWGRSLNVNHRHSRFAREWLLYEGSLTKKLQQHSSGDFRVQLMSQNIQAVRFSEQCSLKLNTRQRALVREVILLVNGNAWVYARTVIPLGTLKGKLRYLQRLGNQPLGEQLFTNPTMQREAVMFAAVANENLPAKLNHSKPLGGRRTLFKLNHKPLLVCEIFLAAIYDKAQRD